MPFIGLRFRFANIEGRRSFTEIFYAQRPTPDPASIASYITTFATQRANALVVTNQVLECVWWDILFPSITTTVPLGIPGTVPGESGSSQDVVNVAYHVQLRASNVRRQYLIRGIADADIVNGSFSPRTTSALRYFNYLQWLRDLTNTVSLRRTVFGDAIPITSITPTQITLTAPLVAPIAKGTTLAVRSQVAGNGPRVTTRVRTMAAAATGASVLSVTWRRGNCTGGDVRPIVQYNLQQLTEVVGRTAARTRKTGGPFTRFRGRRK